MSRTFSVNQGSGITKHVTVGDITLDSIKDSEFQKEGTTTAQIRQVITTVSTYPSKQVQTNMQENLFEAADFGFTGQNFENIENRVAWILVPIGTTEDQLKAKLLAANAAGATIYRVLSNHPILDDAQKYAIANNVGDVTMDTFADRQVVRYPDGHPQKGQLCLDANNKVQYRRTFFWKTPLEDQDMRSTDPADVYLSMQVTLELNMNLPASGVDVSNVLEGQTL